MGLSRDFAAAIMDRGIVGLTVERTGNVLSILRDGLLIAAAEVFEPDHPFHKGRLAPRPFQVKAWGETRPRGYVLMDRAVDYVETVAKKSAANEADVDLWPPI